MLRKVRLDDVHLSFDARFCPPAHVKALRMEMKERMAKAPHTSLHISTSSIPFVQSLLRTDNHTHQNENGPIVLDRLTFHDGDPYGTVEFCAAVAKSSTVTVRCLDLTRCCIKAEATKHLFATPSSRTIFLNDCKVFRSAYVQLAQLKSLRSSSSSSSHGHSKTICLCFTPTQTDNDDSDSDYCDIVTPNDNSQQQQQQQQQKESWTARFFTLDPAKPPTDNSDNPTLSCVVFDHRSTDDITAALPNGHAITEFWADGLSDSDNTITTALRALTRSSAKETLRRIVLSNLTGTSKLVHSCVVALSKAVIACPELVILELLNVRLNDEEAAMLAASIKDSHALLRTLNLNGIQVSNAGFCAIVDGIRASASEKDLHIGLGQPTLQTPTEIADNLAMIRALKGIPTLVGLDFSDRCLGAEGALAVVELLQSPGCRLKKLDVSHCYLFEEGIITIVRGLTAIANSSNTTTTSSNSNNNNATAPVGSHMPTTLQSLSIYGNPIGNPGVLAMTDFLSAPGCALRELLIGEIRIDSHLALDTLAKSLQNSPSLRHCDIGTGSHVYWALQGDGHRTVCERFLLQTRRINHPGVWEVIDGAIPPVLLPLAIHRLANETDLLFYSLRNAPSVCRRD